MFVTINDETSRRTINLDHVSHIWACDDGRVEIRMTDNKKFVTRDDDEIVAIEEAVRVANNAIRRQAGIEVETE